MKRGDRYTVQVTPNLDTGLAERWIKNINVLLKTNLLYSLQVEPDTALKILVDLAGDIVSYQRAIFYLWNEDDRSFYPAVTKGFTGSFPSSLQKGNILVEWTVENGLPIRIVVPDTKDLQEISRLTGSSSAVSLPLTVMNEVRGVLQLFSREIGAFTDEYVRLLWILVLQMEGILHSSEHRKAAPYAETEAGGGLMKRSVFEQELEKEIFRSHRNDRPFSVLLVGLDDFDAIKRKLTVLGVDVLVREVAALIGKAGRKMDVVAQYSDSILAILLPEVEEKRAELFASRMVKTVAAADFPALASQALVKVTISIGIAPFPQAVTPSDLLQAAEAALRTARGKGGNRIESSRGLASSASSQPISLDLQDLLASVGSYFKLQGLVGHLVDFYSRALDADRVSIQLLDPAKRSLRFFEGRGFAGFEDDLRAGSVSLDKSVSGRGILTNRPLLVEDIDRSLPHRARNTLNYSSRSFMSIPLFHEGTALGAINFSNHRDGKPFSREDLDRITRHTPMLAELLSVGMRFEEIQQSFFRRAAEILLGMEESKTPYLSGHGERVASLTRSLALGMSLPEEETRILTDSARFHDLGRIAVDEAVLSKKEPLTDQEKELVRQHPVWSSRILESFHGVTVDLNAIRTHHERYDGKGYPGGLLGEEIPLGGRIIAVADAFDAMTNERPYRPALSREEAMAVLQKNKWSQFDGRVVGLMESMKWEQ